MLKYVSLFFIVSLCSLVRAQEYSNSSSLNLKEIMGGHEFVGYLPENIHWSIDGSQILFDWNPDFNPGNESYSYTLQSKGIEKLTPEFYNSNTDYYGEQFQNEWYYTHNGGLYLYNKKLKETHLIYKSASRVRNIQQWENAEKIYFQEGDELKSYCKKDKCIETIFVFKSGTKPTPAKEKDHWTKEEEQLFQYIREINKTEEWRKEQGKIWSSEIPSFYYGNESLSNVQISPDGKFVTFRLYTPSSNDNTHVEHHISKNGHTYTTDARAKVHDQDGNNRLGIYDFEKDTTYFADFSTLTDIRKKPEYLKLYGDTEALYDKDRNIIMHQLVYSEESIKNVFDIRSYDNKDRWIVSLNLSTGKIEELDHQHDEAWIGGPGISSWNMVSGVLGWLHDGKTIYFQSEESGYSHLYTLHTETNKKEALTSGDWEVRGTQLNRSGSTFFLTTSKTHPGDEGFYHLNISTKELTPILITEGAHEVSVSPDEKWLAIRYSNKNTPWEVFIAPNKANASMEQITHSTTEKFNAYSWNSPDVITFKASDGTPVNARLYQPDTAKKNNAAIIFVHGAGYLQNAHNWWSLYFREYMFHNLLRDNGFTVLDIDYRASAGYGRDHRTAIYRHMGGKDLSDQIDGRQWLIDSLGIDANKVGIYGGSYGGFITLMALLKESGKFQGGAALRSVTDWYHYNHEYTSNILNYPSSDTIAYEQSSPIYFAENLQDRLVMLHGMVDDNVQFQDVVRLSQRFIELGKTNWELALFPVEAHSFKKAYSWTDEYRRIYELFMDELIKD